MISCSQQELRGCSAGDEGSYNRHNAQPAVTAGAVFVCPSSSSSARTGDWMLSEPDLGHGWQRERGGGEDKKQQVVSLLCHIHCVLGPNNGRMRTILMQK